MKLILTKTILKQLKSVHLYEQDIVSFLQKHHFGSTQFPQICRIDDETFCYKIYLRSNIRGIIFLVTKSDVVYPVYIGGKGQKPANNITKQSVEQYLDTFQYAFTKDINNGDFTTYTL